MNEFILLDVAGTLTDVTTSLSNYLTGAVATTISDTRFLYIGSQFAFNSKHFKFTTPNETASVATYEYWDGTVWRPFVYKQDDTSTSTVAFAQSGDIKLIPNKDYSWLRDDTTNIPALSSVTLYDLFWIRIKTDVSITATISWIGRLFASHDDVKSEYPDLGRTEFLTAYQSGKTSWEEQIEVATRLTIDVLITKNIIHSGNQLLDVSKLKLACVSKAAEVIYSALGDDHVDQIAKSRDEFKTRLHNGLFSVDTNNNGKLEAGESLVRMGRLRR